MRAPPEPPTPPTPPEPRDPPDPVERGLHFATRLASETQEEVRAAAIDLYALLDALLARGVIAPEEFTNARHESATHVERQARHRLKVVFGDAHDKYAPRELPDIDCEARIPLCRARCCTFRFALSRQDLDEGVVRWDYDAPYRIAQRDGYCTHVHETTKLCTVYAHRPLPCREFDCREDRGIWIDFPRRIPAP